MKKGISFYFGYDIDCEERVKKIKQSGFDCVITSADKRFKKHNGSIKKQVMLFKKYGLELSSLHMVYTIKELPYFWEKGKLGRKLTRSLIKDVKIAHKYGFSCVVVHLAGEYSLVGEARLKKVLRVCEKLKIPLAIENIEYQKLFLDVFEKIHSPYLKFCYDSGHNNVFDRDFDYLSQFGDKLIALHLHDNNSKEDQHTLARFGTINWEKVAQGLKNKNVVLDYEILMKFKADVTADQCLQETKAMADKLESLIEN